MSTRREKRARRGLPGRVKVPLRERKRAEREAAIEALPDDLTVGDLLAEGLGPLASKVVAEAKDLSVLDAPAKPLMRRLLGL